MKVNGMFSIVRAGFTMPQPLVELAIKQFPTALGTVHLDPEDGLCVNYYNKNDLDLTVDKFMTMQENFKENLKAFWFVKADGPIPADSFQPFVIIKKEGRDAVVALITGDYAKWRDADEDKGETDEYHLVNRVFRPKITKMFTKLCAENTQKLYEELKGSDTDRTEEAAIVAMAQLRGCVGMLFDHGEWLAFDIRNEQFGIPNADWGYSTDRLGWNPDAKPKPSTTEKVKGMFDKVTSVVKYTHRKEGPNSIDAANVAGDTKIPDTADTGSGNVDQFFPPKYKALKEEHSKIWLQCSQDYTTKEERRTWHEMWTVRTPKGDIVSGYKNVTSPPWAEANQTFLDWKAGKLKHFKDMRAAGVEGADRKPVKEAPIITPEKRKTLAEYIASGEAKAKTEQGMVLNASELKAPEKIPLFTAQMADTVGSLEDTFRWDSEYLEKIQKLDPAAMILLTMEYRAHLMAVMIDPKKLDKTKDDDAGEKLEVTEKADPPVDTTTKKKKFVFG